MPSILTKRVVDGRRLHAAFKAYIDNIDEFTDADVCLSNIISTYNEMLMQCTKTYSKQVKLKNVNCPWMSYDLWILTKMKNKYLKKVKLNPFDRNLKDMLHHVSQKVDRVKRVCKRSYYEKILSDSSHRKVWRNINILFGKTKAVQQIALNIDGSLTSSDEETCEAFNSYFSSTVS